MMNVITLIDIAGGLRYNTFQYRTMLPLGEDLYERETVETA